MQKIFAGLIVLLTLLIIIAFFMPWVRIESQAVVGELSKLLTGKEEKISQSLSGFQVPAMANQQDARLAIAVMKIINPESQKVDQESYLIWLVPLLAVVILILSIILAQNQWVHLAGGAIGVLIFIIGLYKINSMHMDQTFLNVSIESGIWLTLWAYLGLGLVELINFLTLLLRRKAK